MSRRAPAGRFRGPAARIIATSSCGCRGFCAPTDDPHAAGDLADAFALAGFFLERHAFAPRGLALPDARERFIAAVLVQNGQPR